MGRILMMVWSAVAGLIAAGVLLALVLPAIPARLPPWAALGVVLACVAAGIAAAAALTRTRDAGR